MNTLYLICDESGAKGKANTTEKFPGEVGVMGGFCLREEDIDGVERDLQEIVSKYQPTSGKFHITDLSENDQQSLRNEVFRYISSNHIVCVYSAIYPEGFHNRYKELKEFGLKHANLSLFVELFKNLFFDSIECALFYSEFTRNEVGIKVLIDNTDLRKDLEQVAKELIDVIKELIDVTEEIDVDDPGQFVPHVSLSSIEIKHGPLTIAADVVVNSIYHYLTKQKSAEQLGKPLVDKEALKEHPLYKNFLLLWEEPKYRSYSDAVFPHKNERAWDKT
jgi:hypothetical protein